MSHPLNGVAELDHLGVIRVQGEEAAKFLQGQLTQDFVLLGADQARLAAYCNPKGRMQASFIGWRRGDDILLVTSRDILAPTLKRLSMFVLRAKVKLSDATAKYRLYGLAGDAATPFAPALAAPWSRTDAGAANVIRLYPADGQARYLWLAPVAEPAPVGPPMDPGLWLWSEVRSAVATLTAPVVEAFVPQMLNYESVGGVNFKKGCYPGQEVVARSQFRGTLKRRAYLAHSPAALTAGQEVFHESDTQQPGGTVVQAAASPSGGWDAIVSLQTSAAQGGSLTATAPDGAPIRLEPLPYLLMVDV